MLEAIGETVAVLTLSLWFVATSYIEGQFNPYVAVKLSRSWGCRMTVSLACTVIRRYPIINLAPLVFEQLMHTWLQLAIFVWAEQLILCALDKVTRHIWPEACRVRFHEQWKSKVCTIRGSCLLSDQMVPRLFQYNMKDGLHVLSWLKVVETLLLGMIMVAR